MAVNKVQLANGTVLMDSTGVTVTPETMLKGVTALSASGNIITGSLSVAEIYYTSQIEISLGGSYTLQLDGVEIDETWDVEARFIDESNKNLKSALELETTAAGVVRIYTASAPSGDVIFTLKLTHHTGKVECELI